MRTNYQQQPTIEQQQQSQPQMQQTCAPCLTACTNMLAIDLLNDFIFAYRAILRN